MASNSTDFALSLFAYRLYRKNDSQFINITAKIQLNNATYFLHVFIIIFASAAMPYFMNV